MNTPELLQNTISVNQPTNESLVLIPLTNIVASSFNPRKSFENEELANLAQSIKNQGLQQPIKVRPIDGGKYEIIYGERRYRACMFLEHTEIKAIIEDMDDEAAVKAAITENLLREDVPPIEQGQAYKSLIDNNGYDHKRISEEFGVSLPTVYTRIKLTNLIPELAELLTDKLIRLGIAEELANYPGTVQKRAYDSHFAVHVASYNSWRRERRESVKEKMENEYSTELSDFPILHSGCSGCIHNSATGQLFTDSSEIVCYNEECLRERIISVLLNKTEELIKANPDLIIEAFYGGDEDVVKTLTEQGFTVEETSKYDIAPLRPSEPIRDKYSNDDSYVLAFSKYQNKIDDYEQKLEELAKGEADGKTYRRILITNRDVLIAYADIEDHPNYDPSVDKEEYTQEQEESTEEEIDNEEAPEPIKASTEELQIRAYENEIVRLQGRIENCNKEYENVIRNAHHSIIADEKEYEGEISEFEEKLFYTLLVGSMLGSVKKKYGISESHYVTDESRQQLLDDWKPEMKEQIMRDYITIFFSNHLSEFGINARAEFIKQHFPDKYLKAEQKCAKERDEQIVANNTKIKVTERLIEELKTQMQTTETVVYEESENIKKPITEEMNDIQEIESIETDIVDQTPDQEQVTEEVPVSDCQQDEAPMEEQITTDESASVEQEEKAPSEEQLSTSSSKRSGKTKSTKRRK